MSTGETAAQIGCVSSKAILKPPLDTSSPAPPVHLEKQFIRQNALENIHRQPPDLKSKEPCYLSKPEYGEVPQYLLEVKARLQRKKVLTVELEQKQVLLVRSSFEL